MPSALPQAPRPPSGRPRAPSRLSTSLLGLAALAAGSVAIAVAADLPLHPSIRLQPEEAVRLTLGFGALPRRGLPEAWPVVPGAGFVPGLPERGLPSLRATHAGLGVAWVGGARGNGATALPSGLALGATWDPSLLERAGAMVGEEARARGYNMVLTGGVHLLREPRSGQSFEAFGEDPLHSGLLGGSQVRGIQSRSVLATLGRFVLDGQETEPRASNARIATAELRESDLLGLQIALEQGRPGAILCTAHRVNGPFGCGSRFLLTDILRHEWGYDGFTVSELGAVEALEFALAGLDLQFAQQDDEAPLFGRALLDAAAQDRRYAARLDEMAHRIARTVRRLGLRPPEPGRVVDEAHHQALALEAALQSIVLLQNRDGLLPLDGGPLLLIGGHADVGTLSGGGSSRVMPDAGPAAVEPFAPGHSLGTRVDQLYHPSSPLKALRARAPARFVDGHDIPYAATLAGQAAVAIVFATQYQSEGFARPDLDLPGEQDALIRAVARANPRTVVVLQTGGPVLMPWRDEVGAIVEAWYPGIQGGEAIARILFGEANPSGHLPLTFPASVEQLPRPRLANGRAAQPSFEVNYDIEGSDVGYRWYARSQQQPAFPFGFGLAYTHFEHERLRLVRDAGGLRAEFRVRNRGPRAGADVVQLYRTHLDDRAAPRLVGFARAMLEPEASRDVDLRIDLRLIAEWEDGGWTVPAGQHRFAVGHDAQQLGPQRTVVLPRIRLGAQG